MYKVCIFDLDGTLTDTLESLTYSVNETLKELGLKEITDGQCRQFIGDGARALIERALKASGDENLTLTERAMEIYGRIFAANCTYHVKAYDGVLEMLEELRDRGVKTAVLSNKPHQQTIDVVEQVLGTGYFDKICGQREGIARKPSPAGVFEILETLGVMREECLYIGDSDVDMETAKQAEVAAVGVSWGFRLREVLEKAGADYIIDTPHELLELIKGGKNNVI